ncbi:MAG: M20/M25/M40 family metallo-hydrolase [Clostridium sp.]
MIQKTIIDYLCNLININTTIDSNNEIEGILYIKEVFDNLGIENKIYEPVSGKGNIIATIKGKSDNKILLHSHIDTANYNSENWLFPPDKSTITNNCVVGRGALDCKGLVSIWMEIMRNLSLNKHIPENTIIFMCSCDEEQSGKYGTEWILENTNIIDNLKLVIGEGGGYPIDLKSDYYFTIQTEEIYPYNSYELKRINESKKYSYDLINKILNQALDLGYYNKNTLEFYNNIDFQGKRKIAKQSFYENIDLILSRNINRNYTNIFSFIESELKSINQNYKLLPTITPGYSDNRFFRYRKIPTLGFFPLDTRNNISGIHGNNEYISFKSLKLSYDILSKVVDFLSNYNY